MNYKFDLKNLSEDISKLLVYYTERLDEIDDEIVIVEGKDPVKQIVSQATDILYQDYLFCKSKSFNEKEFMLVFVKFLSNIHSSLLKENNDENLEMLAVINNLMGLVVK